MGYSFSNLQVRNEDGRIQPEQVLDVLLAGQHLTKAEQADRADGMIAFGAKTGSPWFTVVSGLFDEDPEQSVSLARELSGKLGTAVLAVSGLDSDYLFLNLHDAAHSVDARASCGRFTVCFTVWVSDQNSQSRLKSACSAVEPQAHKVVSAMADTVFVNVSFFIL